MTSPTALGPFYRDHLVGVDDVVHLYSGAEGPALRAHREAAARYVVDKSAGEEGRRRSEAVLDTTREQLARLMGGSANSIAILGNASDAINRLVGAVRLEPGDNVVTSDLEFPSGVQSLLLLRDRGVEVRFARGREGHLSAADFEPMIDERTRLVVSSHTSYVSGARIDPATVHALARRVGAAFILDVTQSLGVLPVVAATADAIVSSSYKWVLGPHGLGIVHLTNPAAFGHAAAGWRSVPDVFAPDRLSTVRFRPDARSLELGFPSFLGAYFLTESLALILDADQSAVEAHVNSLTAQLVDGLLGAGARLLSPLDPAERGTNISVVAADGESVAARMLESGVRVWGGDGRVRFSVHAFNTANDIDAALAAYRAAA
ncbi:aminotransferase class V-fold PLP-dependent enzyme [Antiquaquibacter soli]|uniref:Aminotransferase class V-fold PLP-dependent enzyme n=1 Tax=Antiquaquibacter soli TaxID=3064523 RepID=A0ABT9BJG3_9MICO|nr:aminotransferase class V-fold PLP-dependent enzyme [Protaetiibacter sp. WY-16]MDO7881164.1 aminotransferase class V-fold PLP-dependent enzyme [Protaetiibacter sp. WY-16]